MERKTKIQNEEIVSGKNSTRVAPKKMLSWKES